MLLSKVLRSFGTANLQYIQPSLGCYNVKEGKLYCIVFFFLLVGPPVQYCRYCTSRHVSVLASSHVLVRNEWSRFQAVVRTVVTFGQVVTFSKIKTVVPRSRFCYVPYCTFLQVLVLLILSSSSN